MKTARIIIFFAIVLFSMNQVALAQEEQKRPAYVVVTTMHWNMDMEDFDMDTWKAVEKERLDKVVRKNEHIMNSHIFLHRFTPDNTELLLVQTYENWNDIHDAAARSSELAKEAWPDQKKRNEFFDKYMSYYSPNHSDEIYAVMDGAKLLEAIPDKDMILYVRKGHWAYPEDGSGDEWRQMREDFGKMVNANQYVKGYYPHEHYYGADRTEFVEAFWLDSMDDLDNMLERMGELWREHNPDEKAREEKGKRNAKYFTGVHGDYIYNYVAGLSK